MSRDRTRDLSRFDLSGIITGDLPAIERTIRWRKQLAVTLKDLLSELQGYEAAKQLTATVRQRKAAAVAEAAAEVAEMLRGAGEALACAPPAEAWIRPYLNEILARSILLARQVGTPNEWAAAERCVAALSAARQELRWLDRCLAIAHAQRAQRPAAGDDLQDYIAAKDCRSNHITTHKQLKALLAKGGIRHKHRGKHLYVHAAEWHRWNADQDTIGSNAMDAMQPHVAAETARFRTQKSQKKSRQS
jgi:hypothetical protein